MVKCFTYKATIVCRAECDTGAEVGSRVKWLNALRIEQPSFAVQNVIPVLKWVRG